VNGKLNASKISRISRKKLVNTRLVFLFLGGIFVLFGGFMYFLSFFLYFWGIFVLFGGFMYFLSFFCIFGGILYFLGKFLYFLGSFLILPYT
jgi:hypothetical protein